MQHCGAGAKSSLQSGPASTRLPPSLPQPRDGTAHERQMVRGHVCAPKRKFLALGRHEALSSLSEACCCDEHDKCLAQSTQFSLSCRQRGLHQTPPPQADKAAGSSGEVHGLKFASHAGQQAPQLLLEGWEGAAVQSSRIPAGRSEAQSTSLIIPQGLLLFQGKGGHT